MATKVQLTVDVNEQAVLTQLANIDQQAQKLGAKPYKLNFEVTGIDQLTKTLETLTASLKNVAGQSGDVEAVGKAFKTVTNYTTDADGAFQQFTTRTKETRDSLAQTTKSFETFNKEEQKWETTSKQVTVDIDKQAKALEKQAKAQAQDHELTRKATFAAQDYEKALVNEQKATEAASTATIKSVVGYKEVGDSCKSAAQSASVFEQQFKRIGEATGTITDDTTIEGMTSLIRGMEGFGNATVTANGSFQSLGKTFQVYNAEVDNGNGTLNKFAFSVDQATGQVYQLDKGLVQGSKTVGLLGDSLTNIVAKIVAWQVINAAVAAVIRSFKNAVTTIKEVDTALTQIQKTTGATNEAMKSLGDTAYDTASKYGVAATEYLSAAGTFAKAGFSNYEQLAELATKTQLVGDVTEDVASQFLISASAAYKYEGNIEKLNKVLDAANTIENNYATSIEKLAEGFPIVASTAAMANVSVEELMAGLGTITSATQESGTKAATALRAIILNVMGEVGAEIEDGVETTQESIDSLDALLVKYAPDAVAAAKATGEIINPMEALYSLSKAATEGLMTEAELADLLSSLGGKLRTNQLSAIVNNWSMYEEMLAKVQESAGSADKEVSIMLSSWESKTNQLNNTWTEFIQNFVNTALVKGSIDALIGTIDFLDNGFTKFAGTVALTTTAVALFGKGIAAIKGTALISTLAAATASAADLTAGISLLTETLLASPLFWVAAGTAAFYGIVKYIEKVRVTLDEQREIVAELNSEYETMFGQGSEYDTLISKTEELTEKEKIRLAVLEAQRIALAERLRLEKEEEFNKFTAETSERTGGVMGAGVRLTTPSSAQAFLNAINGIGTITSAQDYENARSTLLQAISDYETYYNNLITYQEQGQKLNEEQIQFIANYEAVSKMLVEVAEDTETATEAIDKQADSVEKLTHNLETAQARIKAFNDALDEGEKGDTARNYDDIYDKFLEDWTSGKKGTNLVKAAIKTFFSDAQIEAANYDYSKLGEILSSGIYSAIFSDDNELGFEEAFAQYVLQNQSAIGEAIRVIDNGESYQIMYSSAEEVADALQLDIDLVVALLDALGAYSELGTVKDEAEDATDAVKNLEDTADNADVTLEVENNVSPEIDALDNQLKTFVDKWSNVTISISTSGTKITYDKSGRKTYTSTDGTLVNTIQGHAYGGISSGGATLVNELGAELISDNGQAYIANNGNPAIVNLSKGAIVLPADVTANVLGTSGKTMPMRAAAGGSSAYNDYLVSTSKKSSSSASNAYNSYLIGKAQTSSNIPKTGNTTTAVAVATSTADKESAMDLLEATLDNLDAQIELAEYQNDHKKVLDTYAKAQDEIAKTLNDYIAQGYAMDSDEVLKLQNLGYKYANKQVSYAGDIKDDLWNDLVDAIKALTEAEDDANALAEKQLAVDKARESYENAQRNRNVRVFNAATGQWEWIANANTVQSAQDSLTKAQKSLYDEQLSQDLKAITNSNGENVIIGSALGALLSGSSEEDLQPLATALQAYYGSVDMLGSTTPNSAFTNVQDSHDTVYTFPGGITLTQEQAEHTTLADLARQLQVLNIT